MRRRERVDVFSVGLEDELATGHVAECTATASSQQGSTLTATPGSWDGFPAPTITYQWYRGATPIGGATGLTYDTVEADIVVGGVASLRLGRAVTQETLLQLGVLALSLACLRVTGSAAG